MPQMQTVREHSAHTHYTITGIVSEPLQTQTADTHSTLSLGKVTGSEAVQPEDQGIGLAGQWQEDQGTGRNSLARC